MTNAKANGKPTLVFHDIIQFAYDTFCSNKIRFVLTSFGMVIGTASLILVVTIGLTGKQYIVRQIQSIGANMIYVFYEGGSKGASTTPDMLRLDDMEAVREQVPGVMASSPMIELRDRIATGGGKDREVQMLGIAPEYAVIRNLQMIAGRFIDADDISGRNKAALITAEFASKQYGNTDSAVGQQIRIAGLPFTIVGVFKERVETFGQTEIQGETVLIPYTVARMFTGTDYVKQIFFSMADATDVPRASTEIQSIIKSRHRPGSVYYVDNLTQLLSVADRAANAMTAILLLVAAVTLVVSGIGIMNIMLATVNSRIREIGVRKAIGATNREIKYQFLAEALLLSLAGGFVGTSIGLAIPISARFLTSFRVPISGLSVIIAIGISSLVGILFGTVPAVRAAKLDPVESLRYE